MRFFMTFETRTASPLPTDGKELPVGRDLALLMTRGLQARGLTIQEQVDQHDSYGWYFVVTEDEQSVWCMLQRSDEWLLITKPELPFLKRLFGRQVDQEMHRRVCEALHAVAVDCPEILEIRRFTEEEFQGRGPGAECP